MSTAFFPTNMRRQAAGGYSNNSTLENIPYVPWKGTGIFRNPVGVTATHIRPLTNNDPGNVFPTGFGLPRPIKHYRKGTVIPINFNVLTINPNLTTSSTALEQSLNSNTLTANAGKAAIPPNAAQYVEKSLIEYNVNRAVKSSLASSLGGGNGGTGMISQLIDMPGSFIVKDNGGNSLAEGLDTSILTDNRGLDIDAECKSCNGVGIVSSWYPINNLTEKPEQNVTNPLLCCNQQRKAIDRVLPTNTNISKKYYQTTYMYLYHRCQTFQQRQFNFVRGPVDEKLLKLFLAYPFVTAKILQYTQPGDPLSILNYYVAQCNPNFTVETAVEIGFINSLSKSLLEAKFISELEYTNLINSSPISIQIFISSLQKILTNEQYKLVIDYMYQLAANPYNGSVLAGPSNPKGCAQVYYKPNNPQFAKQGGVASSTRILKLNVDTISTAAANRLKLKRGNLNSAQSTLYADPSNTPFILKEKVPPCQAATFIGNPFFFQGQHQNKLICRQTTNGQEYHTYNSINNSAAGNYIGATQSGGAGYTNKSQIPNTTYFDNLYYSSLKQIAANSPTILGN
jgi:hypothetical protein